MTLTTQAGRVLEISRKYRLGVWTSTAGYVTITVEEEPRRVPTGKPDAHYHDELGNLHVQTSYRWQHVIISKAVIGEYKTTVRREKAAELLRAAWKKGAAQFVMPAEVELTPNEQFEEYCEEHGLILASVSELGYKPSDEFRNRQLVATTDTFERRNILVADEFGNYDKSLAKWKGQVSA